MARRPTSESPAYAALLVVRARRTTDRDRPERKEKQQPMTTTASPTQFRQGDVFLRQVGSVPEGCTPVARDKGRIVLAYGEVTGHAHAIADEAAQLVVTDDDVRLLLVEAEVALRHEEHATITIPPGSYEVVQQREYTPDEIRNVAD
ncbi:MAG: hypothetical protein M3N28_08580 [Actinomycetota bacterium]|nr:hypothetical protein [Actinomycetota bacterium]